MSPVPTDPRIVGRQDEFTVLGQALDRAFSGRLAVVLVEGEAGIGKSTVLSQGLVTAAARGAEVVAGRVEELERTRPFGVWVEALQLDRAAADPRRAAIGALLTTPAEPDPPITVSNDPGLQFQVVDAVVDLVEDLAHERTLVIGLDDLHWADPASLLTLAVLVRRSTDASVAVIGCRRPLPAPPELERVLARLGAAGAVTLPVDGLSDDAVVELVGQVVAAAPDIGLIREVSGAGGNPLLVTELLAALESEGAITVRDGRAMVAGRPPAVRLPVERHLAYLPEETLAALRPASVLGTRFAVPDLAVTTGRSVLELSVALEPAVIARVLVEDGVSLRFRHDLLRDAVYAGLGEGVRRGLHREAARRLADAGGSALTVAEQLSRGATPGDADAVEGLAGAAREVAPRSPATAAELLGRAIELAGPAGPERDRLVAERATSLWWAGELAAAEDACRGLLGRRCDPEAEQTARLCLARVLIMTGRLADALPELERVGHSPAAPSRTRSAALGWAGVARGSMGDLDGSESAARRALAGAEQVGDPVIAGVALNSLAAVAEHRGDPAAALAVLDQAVDRADRSPSQVGHRYPLHITRGHVLLELDRLADARATLETGRSIGERLGTRWALPSYEVFLAAERFLAGEWDDALAGLETGLALAEETGERYSLVFGLSVSAIVHLYRGDLGRTAEALHRADRELATTGPAFRGDRVSWSRALLLEAEGAVDEAFAVLDPAFRRCADSGRVVELPVLGPDLVRLAMAVGDRGCAQRVAEAVHPLAGRGIPSWDSAALRCRGLCTADADLLAAAVDAAADPLHVALAAEEAAAASTEPARACAQLERAAEAFDRLGAARGTDRVEAALRGWGVRRGRRGRRARPRTGWDSLTPTERRVVDLVAEGLSNPQIGERLFLSRRTVQTHVGHVFGKLGLSSRTELAAAAARRAP